MNERKKSERSVTQIKIERNHVLTQLNNDLGKAPCGWTQNHTTSRVVRARREGIKGGRIGGERQGIRCGARSSRDGLLGSQILVSSGFCEIEPISFRIKAV